MFRTALLFILLGFSTTALARGYADVSALPEQPTPGAIAADPAPALADRIDLLLTMRFQMIAHAQDGTTIVDQRAALEGLDTFAAATIEGLIAAAPMGEMQTLMAARLQPILARHQGKIAAALAALDEGPEAPPAPVDTVQGPSGPLGRAAPTFHE